jgi:anti-sigma regulatory factor (Ser/Thr protein kinase)
LQVKVDKVAQDATGHVVQFYERVDDLVANVVPFLAEGLLAGDVAVLVATDEHSRAFMAGLEAAGIDWTTARAEQRLIVLDAGAALARFMTDEHPDGDLFDDVIGGVVRDAAATGRGVRAYGEMVAMLWDAGLVTAAIELEDLWNDLGGEVTFKLYCAYPASSVIDDAHAHALARVCQQHSAIVSSSPTMAPSPCGDITVEDSRSFERDAQAPRNARAFVTDALTRWDHTELAETASLIVSELATNAIIHARTAFTVTVASLVDGVRITVRDSNTKLPRRRDASPAASSGRGLDIVAKLARNWGAVTTQDGKLVWAELGP